MHRCNVSQNRQYNYLSSLFNQLIRQLCIPGVSSSVHYITSQDIFHQDHYSFTKACKSLRIECFLECGITAFGNILFTGKQQTNKKKKMEITVAQYQAKKWSQWYKSLCVHLKWNTLSLLRSPGEMLND